MVADVAPALRAVARSDHLDPRGDLRSRVERDRRHAVVMDRDVANRLHAVHERRHRSAPRPGIARDESRNGAGVGRDHRLGRRRNSSARNVGEILRPERFGPRSSSGRRRAASAEPGDRGGGEQRPHAPPPALRRLRQLGRVGGGGSERKIGSRVDQHVQAAFAVVAGVERKGIGGAVRRGPHGGDSTSRGRWRRRQAARENAWREPRVRPRRRLPETRPETDAIEVGTRPRG